MLIAAAAEADDGDAEVTVGASGLGIGLGAETRHGGSQGGVLDKLALVPFDFGARAKYWSTVLYSEGSFLM